MTFIHTQSALYGTGYWGQNESYVHLDNLRDRLPRLEKIGDREGTRLDKKRKKLGT